MERAKRAEERDTRKAIAEEARKKKAEEARKEIALRAAQEAARKEAEELKAFAEAGAKTAKEAGAPWARESAVDCDSATVGDASEVKVKVSDSATYTPSRGGCSADSLETGAKVCLHSGAAVSICL